MFCPSCRGEFRADIVECPRCNVPLTTDPAEPASEPTTPLLPTAASLAILGTALIFLVRTVATFAPSPDPTFARIGMVVVLAAYAAILFFLVVFLREAVGPSRRRLRLGAWALLAGCAAAAVIVGLHLAVLFNRPIVVGHQLEIASSVVSMLVRVGAVLFFAGALADLGSAPVRLVTAVKLALVGAILSAGMHGVAALLVGPSPAGAADLTPLLLLGGFPIVAFAFATWIFFLWVIRQGAGETTFSRTDPPGPVGVGLRSSGSPPGSGRPRPGGPGSARRAG